MNPGRGGFPLCAPPFFSPMRPHPLRSGGEHIWETGNRQVSLMYLNECRWDSAAATPTGCYSLGAKSPRRRERTLEVLSRPIETP